ncbi:MAG: NAD(P)/FAD-dependent oxidoreductase [Halioglobus sp.]
MKKIDDAEIVIIGAGIAGIATAYYLCKKYQRKSVLLIDSRDPMSYTSAQSGDNYRNWWPSKQMTQFTEHSISLMHDIARESANVLQMKQRGYALATRRTDIQDLVETLESNYKTATDLVRHHTGGRSASYVDPHNDDWASSVNGVDVISNKQLIQRTFPAFSNSIENVLHIRRAGDFSGQQMGTYMLEQIKPFAHRRLRGHVETIASDGRYTLEIKTQDGNVSLKADIVVNAAGPYVGEIANMLGVKLPVTNIFHQKIAFEDTLATVPRDQPFSIDMDKARLEWSDEELLALSEDPNLSWLAGPIDGGTHCRPEGTGRWIKLGWAYNRTPSRPDNQQELINDPRFDANFPEIVLRGAARLNPNLRPYVEKLPPGLVHYGGYYTMTEENWPLVGPLDSKSAFIVGALSGFGSMASCAAGSLCADWICDGELPQYAHSFALSRYQDPELIAQMSTTDIGLL